MYTNKESLVDYLIDHSLAFPHKTAFVLLKDGEEPEVEISYRALASAMITLAAQLTARRLNGKRALLVYQDISEFIVSFMACQYAGVIPVPVSYVKGKKQIARLLNIISDAQVSAVFCTASSVAHLQQGLSDLMEVSGIELVVTDQDHPVPLIQEPAYNETVFIQYTSGSTGKPKGVIVSRDNLLHNQQLIKNVFGCDEGSTIFSWLPFHHDMGLIGNILHTLYVGCTCILMSPFHFMQKPQRWLEGISRFKATHSGAPNFAYDLCVDKIPMEKISCLDLSGWRVAYNGSEPVRFETIQRFATRFGPAGFRQSTFYPCYGLAEATLLVAGRKNEDSPLVIDSDKDDGRRIISSGALAPGMDCKIIRMTDQGECAELEEGEICISGGSVTSGYWNKDNESLFHTIGGKSFLRTGDLGFFYKDELFVHGRHKEMLILRGRNLYPYDIELLVSECDNAIEANGVVLFGDETLEGGFVIVAEINRTMVRDIDAARVISAIDRAVSGTFGIVPHDIVLTTPLGIPRTTSGKLQRVKCRDHYRDREFTVIGSKLMAPAAPVSKGGFTAPLTGNSDYHAIRQYLINVIESKVGRVPDGLMDDEAELTELGLDSLRIMEMINAINRDLNVNIDASMVFQGNSLSGVVDILEKMLWLKNTQNLDEEITI